LINLGFVALFMKSVHTLNDVRGGIELVSTKVGTVMLVLGIMHFFNIWLFNKIRNREDENQDRFSPVAGKC